MTQNTNLNFWAKAGIAVVLLAAIVGVWLYLAGAVLLAGIGLNYNDANLFTYLQYLLYFRAHEKVHFWLIVGAVVASVLVFAPALLFLGGKKRSLFGDARFAKKSEVAKSGLLGEKGLLVGRYNNRYLCFDSQQHLLMAAPTRSGKGVGVVIPNLLNWPESIVVLDIKQENWGITSRFRQKHGQACYLFNPAPTDYRTHRYNPLEYVSADPNFRIDDVQKIANMLFPDEPGTDVIWTATPRTLFLGLALMLFEIPGKTVTLGQVLRETLVDGDGSKYLANVINQQIAAGKPLSGTCVRALNSYISIASENTRAGVMTGLRSRLELWNNPLVDAATSANDFDLRKVRKEKMSIYLGVTPDNLDRMAPLLNLFFQQLIDLNTRELPNQNPQLKYTCVLLMDEFTAIGKIPILSKGISYIAGYNLRMMPIIQSPSQLVEVYGADAALTFTTNHALQIVYPPKASETKTAQDISDWLGYQTVKGKSVSKSKAIFSKKNPSESVSDQRRALLLPQEITSLGSNRELVVLENVPPILAKKIQYYNDHAFIDRLKSVSPSLAALGRKKPSKGQLDRAINAGELAAAVPSINLTLHGLTTGDSVTQPVRAATPKGAAGNVRTVTIERPVMPGDLPNLSKLSLSDFVVDFSTAPKPAYGDLNIDALNAFADRLCVAAGIS